MRFEIVMLIKAARECGVARRLYLTQIAPHLSDEAYAFGLKIAGESAKSEVTHPPTLGNAAPFPLFPG